MSGFFHENTKQFLPRSETSTDYQKQLFPFYEEVLKHIHFKSYPRFKQISLTKRLPEKFRLKEITRNCMRTEELEARPLTLDEISTILFYSAGITCKEEGGDYSLRSYPSIGSRYPLELYPITFRNSGVEAGIYHYNVKLHSLESIAEGDFTNQIVHCTHNQEWIKNAGMILLLSAVFKRSEILYGERGYRYVLFEAGHLAQNISVVSNRVGLGCSTIGEFLDDELNKLLDLDGVNESILYIVVVGREKLPLHKRIRSLFDSR